MLYKLEELLQKRKKARLFQQWTTNSGLPVEEVPPDISGEPRPRHALATALVREKTAPSNPGSENQQSLDLRAVNQYMQHVFLLWLTITILLVLLAIAATLLLTQS